MTRHDVAEPWCNHDPAAVRAGVCECGHVMAAYDSRSDLEVATIAAAKRIDQIRKWAGVAGVETMTEYAMWLADEAETLLAYVRQTAEFGGDQ